MQIWQDETTNPNLHSVRHNTLQIIFFLAQGGSFHRVVAYLGVNMHKWWSYLLENLICAEQCVQINGGRHKQEQYSGSGAALKGNTLCSCSIISSAEQVTEWEDNACGRKKQHF